METRSVKKVIGVVVAKKFRRAPCHRDPAGWRCGLCGFGLVRARGRASCGKCGARVVEVEYHSTNPARDFARF